MFLKNDLCQTKAPKILKKKLMKKSELHIKPRDKKLWFYLRLKDWKTSMFNAKEQ